ncbi:MAG: hypothetical protein M1827_006797 [Pycnora praestabilis]|nr:MAG: hypothetical protein M1827_006797 [Pycnora praestabilis]
MFYCTAPGLMMWVLDWSMRLYELRTSLDGKILAMGRGWYCLSVPLPRHRLDGCACKSPLAHFYIHHSDSSVRELHPFTTTTHLASKNSTTHETEDDIEIQFLFRKRQASVATQAPSVARLGFAPSFFGLIRKVKRRKKSSQWTDRLASLTNKTESITQTSNTTIAPEHESVETPGDVPVSLRLEGPYFTPADPACYRTVVCIVAGTGVSGALAIAGAFKEQERQLATIADAGSQAGQPNFAERKFGEVASKNERHDSIMIIPKDRVWKRCIVIWSVREDDYIDLPALRNTSTSALEVRVHFTGKGRSRLSVGDALDEFLSADGEELRTSSGLASMWVYLSGPNAFIAAGEAACKAREERRVDWFGAKWDI